MEEKQEDIPKSQIVVEKSRVGRFLKIFSVILLVIIVVFLILYKIYNPEFSMKWVIVIGVGFSFVCLLIFFSFEIIDKFKKSEKLLDKDKNPAPITLKQAHDLAETIIGSELCDYIEYVDDEGVEEHGKILKQKIYFIYCKGLYTKQMYFIAINMHYPETNRRYKINPTKREIMFVKKNLATDPEEPPDKEKIEREIPMLGTKETITKTTRKKDIKDTKLKGDLG